MTNDLDKFNMTPHYWTEDEIVSVPRIHKWFYGLVIDDNGRLVICEISPGYGYSEARLDENDSSEPGKPANIEEQFAGIASDIMYWSPDRVADHFSDRDDEHDDEIAEPVHVYMVPEFRDDRSHFLKLLDSRWLIDYVLNNMEIVFRMDDIENLGGERTEEWVDSLIKCGIISDCGGGAYKFDKYNPLSSDFRRIYSTLEKWSRWEKNQS